MITLYCEVGFDDLFSADLFSLAEFVGPGLTPDYFGGKVIFATTNSPGIRNAIIKNIIKPFFIIPPTKTVFSKIQEFPPIIVYVHHN